ncbi:ABC transporter permease [Oscillospiraceae bacterium OttesenSCG-928-G22]|nr:ABC transporter permease [Oscillospiraceae bacterium OttesenSCG-928-G22]
MSLLKFLVKRVLLSIFVLFGLSIIIFFIARVVPGDPARMALGSRAPEFALEQYREEMHLNDPFPTQYAYWLSGVVRGDFGNSITTKRNVLQDIQEFLPATLELMLYSAIMMILGSILLGTLAARFRDKFLDGLIRAFSYVGVAIPAFVLAVFFILAFGMSGRISQGLTPPPTITGMVTIDALLSGNFSLFLNALLHILPPSFALCAGGLFQEARIVRNSMTENMGKEYIISLRGYGVPNTLLFRKYMLKPSLIPAVSVMGLDIAALVGNAFLVETIFSWPGISRYGIYAMMSNDLNAISGTVLVCGLIFVTVNIIVDVIVAKLDPRIRLGGA